MLLQLPKVGAYVMVRSVPLDVCTPLQLAGDPICCSELMVNEGEDVCLGLLPV